MKNLVLSIDSGAHSWFENYIKHKDDKSFRTDKHLDYSIVRSRFFKTYLDRYIGYLHEVGSNFQFYVTLDILGHPKYSWDIIRYMESNGLKPVPVFHLHEDFSWLTKMIDNYEYIGVGVVNKGGLVTPFQGWIKKVFEEYIQKPDGSPRVKVHGFAANALDILKQYPFYSCDASTWSFGARLGHVQIPDPIIKNNEVIGWDYFPHAIKSIALTERRTGEAGHYAWLSDSNRRIIDSYFHHVDADIEKLQTEYFERDYVNAMFFIEAEKELKKHYESKFNFGNGGNVYLAGTASSCSSSVVNLYALVDRIFKKQDTIRFLLSIWYSNYGNLTLAIKDYLENGSGDLPENEYLTFKRQEIVAATRLASEETKRKLFNTPHLEGLTLEELESSISGKAECLRLRQSEKPKTPGFFAQMDEEEQEVIPEPIKIPIRRRGVVETKVAPVEQVSGIVETVTDDSALDILYKPEFLEPEPSITMKVSPVILLQDLELQVAESMTVKELNRTVEKAVTEFLNGLNKQFKILSISIEEHLNDDHK